MSTATAQQMHLDSAKRHDFVFLFDCKDGNPNGDPDMGNLPRTDPETNHGLVTDVCLKRKIRNYVKLAQVDKPRYRIYVEERSVLNLRNDEAYAAHFPKATADEKKKARMGKEDVQDTVRSWMCNQFFDIRMFGAVMTTEVNCGQVRGPLQLTFSRSIDPVFDQDWTVTRMAVTTERESDKQDGGNRTMGKKAWMPYGLYLCHGFFNPHFAAQTGADGEDLSLVWEALVNMFEQDRSASRGMMACRGLYVFTHDKPLGNAPAHKLFERVSAKLQPGVEAPRKFSDYSVTVDDANLPDGVTLTKVLE